MNILPRAIIRASQRSWQRKGDCLCKLPVSRTSPLLSLCRPRVPAVCLSSSSALGLSTRDYSPLIDHTSSSSPPSSSSSCSSSLSSSFTSSRFCYPASPPRVAHIHSTSTKFDAPKLAAKAALAADDPSEQPSPPAPKILKLVDEISKLTLLEVSQLTELLREKLNIPAMPPMGMMMPMGAGMMPGGAAAAPGTGAAEAGEEKAAEKTEFDVKLEKFAADAKIKIIKEVRTFTALGLKEAKELVEKAPIVIKKGVGKDEANGIVEKLKALGATCVLE